MFYVLCQQLNYSAFKFHTGFEGINVTCVLLAQQESFFSPAMAEHQKHSEAHHVLIKAVYFCDGSFSIPCQQSEPALECITLQRLRHADLLEQLYEVSATWYSSF